MTIDVEDTVFWSHSNRVFRYTKISADMSFTRAIEKARERKNMRLKSRSSGTELVLLLDPTPLCCGVRLSVRSKSQVGGRKPNAVLTATETRDAEIIIIRRSQRESFYIDVARVLEGEEATSGRAHPEEYRDHVSYGGPRPTHRKSVDVSIDTRPILGRYMVDMST